MEKTSVYLPLKLKTALERLARERNCSQAELVREAVAALMRGIEVPAPRLPLFRSTGPSIAERIDEEFAKDFGTR